MEVRGGGGGSGGGFRGGGSDGRVGRDGGGCAYLCIYRYVCYYRGKVTVTLI